MIQGTIESKARSGAGIKVQGNWYNGSAGMLAGYEWKDEVVIVVDGKNVVSINRPSGASAPASSNSGGFTGKKGNVQDAIVYQSSRKDAVALVTAALTAGILPLPNKSQDKWDACLALVDKYTDIYHQEAMQVHDTAALPARQETE